MAGSSSRARRSSLARSAAAVAEATALAGPEGQRRGSATKPSEYDGSEPAGQPDPPRVKPKSPRRASSTSPYGRRHSRSRLVPVPKNRPCRALPGSAESLRPKPNRSDDPVVPPRKTRRRKARKHKAMRPARCNVGGSEEPPANTRKRPESPFRRVGKTRRPPRRWSAPGPRRVLSGAPDPNVMSQLFLWPEASLNTKKPGSGSAIVGTRRFRVQDDYYVGYKEQTTKLL